MNSDKELIELIYHLHTNKIEEEEVNDIIRKINGYLPGLFPDGLDDLADITELEIEKCVKRFRVGSRVFVGGESVGMSYPNAETEKGRGDSK